MNPPALIPFFDYQRILDDLRTEGWKDYKIEIACGFSVGFIAQLRRRHMADMLGQNAVRLHNLWADEMARVGRYVSAHTLVNTT